MKQDKIYVLMQIVFENEPTNALWREKGSLIFTNQAAISIIV